MRPIIDHNKVKEMLEVCPPTKEELSMANWDLRDYGLWYAVYNNVTKHYDFPEPTKDMILNQVLYNRKLKADKAKENE